MKVSVVNFCSTALDMLDFSSRMLIDRAGTKDFDYVVVTWNPSPEVVAWIKGFKPTVGLHHAEYFTDKSLAYIPNLRAMMSMGFEAGYQLNEWVVIVNTDMAFWHNWLSNLVPHAQPLIIPNSVHITPITGPHCVTANLGIPTKKTFDMARFEQMCRDLSADRVETEKDRGGWRNCATMPYVLHRDLWRQCGPWEANVVPRSESPDRRFFGRCHDAGARFVLVHNSICYHHEAVERRSGTRPPGIETMPEGK
jgi:hypothetical protein